MKIIFAGTPEFAATALAALLKTNHEIVAVYTQPDRKAGRGQKLTASAVKQLALEHHLSVYQPLHFKSSTEEGLAAQAELKALNADVMVVAAYGLILPQVVLDTPKYGCLNIHGSLLPRWRGAAPIQRAIMAGDAETGMMVMKMDKGLDTGPVALTQKVTIGPDMTAGDLHDALSVVGAEAMVEAMAKLEAGTLETVIQAEDGVLYAAKIDKAETRVDFSRSATEVHNHIRGLSPFPGAWTEVEVNGKPERVKLLASRLAEKDGVLAAAGTALDDHLTIACGTGAISLVRLQKAGGKALNAEDFLRGTPLPKGTVIA